MDEYNRTVTEQPSSICDSIATAETCISDCSLNIPHFNFERQLNEDSANNHCTEVTTTQPPCEGSLPDYNSNLEIMELEDPIISYQVPESPCIQNTSKDKRHCSMFTYSHIRQFSRNTIQTCSVGMLHTLINLPNKLAIMVTAVANSQLSQYTKLQEVRQLL